MNDQPRKRSKHGGYGRVHREKVMSGDLRPIATQPATLSVYLAYCAHANVDGIAWLGEDSIVNAFGITAEAVRTSRRTLERYELLIDTGERKVRCKVYRVNWTPQCQLGDQNDPYPNTNGSCTPTRDHQHPKKRTRDTPKDVGTNRTNNRTASNSPPAHAVGAAAVLSALMEAGIGKTRAESLIDAIPLLSVAAVRSLAKRISSRVARDKIKLPGAYLARLIEDEGEAESVRLSNDAKRRADGDDRRRRDAAQREANLRAVFDKNRKTIDALITKMDDAKLKREIRRLHLSPEPTPDHVRSEDGWYERLLIYRNNLSRQS